MSAPAPAPIPAVIEATYTVNEDSNAVFEGFLRAKLTDSVPLPGGARCHRGSYPSHTQHRHTHVPSCTRAQPLSHTLSISKMFRLAERVGRAWEEEVVMLIPSTCAPQPRPFSRPCVRRLPHSLTHMHILCVCVCARPISAPHLPPLLPSAAFPSWLSDQLAVEGVDACVLVLACLCRPLFVSVCACLFVVCVRVCVCASERAFVRRVCACGCV